MQLDIRYLTLFAELRFTLLERLMCGAEEGYFNAHNNNASLPQKNDLRLPFFLVNHNKHGDVQTGRQVAGYLSKTFASVSLRVCYLNNAVAFHFIFIPHMNALTYLLPEQDLR